MTLRAYRQPLGETVYNDQERYLGFSSPVRRWRHHAATAEMGRRAQAVPFEAVEERYRYLQIYRPMFEQMTSRRVES